MTIAGGEEMTYRIAVQSGRVAAAIHLLLTSICLGGCFVSTRGSFESDAISDPASDTALDSTDGVIPDQEDDTWADTSDLEDVDIDGWDGSDLPDVPSDTTMDTLVDPDLPPDPVDTSDPPPDPAEDWICTTVYGDPACEDSNPCTSDWCVLATHTCSHSGATMEGTSCPDDGNECTADTCHGGVCSHTASREGEFCADDGNICTADSCASGVCTHPGAPRDGDACPVDADSCTTDLCEAGACVHDWITNCCHRDGDCIWLGHIWECNGSTSICYPPPQGAFCADCTTRDNCGDGGSSSDDWCVYYGTNHGCSKDCRADIDCPRGASCMNNSGSAACSGTDTGCICEVRVGDCSTWNSFGDSCSSDPQCPGPDNYCFGSYCTWDCASVADCPLEAVSGCVMGTCRR